MLFTVALKTTLRAVAEGTVTVNAATPVAVVTTLAGVMVTSVSGVVDVAFANAWSVTVAPVTRAGVVCPSRTVTVTVPARLLFVHVPAVAVIVELVAFGTPVPAFWMRTKQVWFVTRDGVVPPLFT